MGRYRTFESKKDEQNYDAAIWWVLWLISLAILIYTAYHQIHEFNLTHSDNYVIAKYMVANGHEAASYTDENGVYYYFNITQMNAIHDEDTIKMYYKDDIALAVPRCSFLRWAPAWSIFLPALIGCSVLLWKIYHRNYNG